MVKYSLALLSVATVAVLFSGCGEGGCCATPAPTAVIAGLKAGEVITRESFTLNGSESYDNNSDGRVVDYLWTVDGEEVADGYTLPVGTHNVCLTVTDNSNLKDTTCGKVTITATSNQAPTARITPSLPTSCTAGEVINVSGATSSDTDGNIASYAWTPASIGTSASGTITCPSSGSFQVCLTVTDNDGATNRDCSGNIAVNVPTVPTFGLSQPVSTGGDGFNILCSNGDSNITLGTDIKEVYWGVTYNTLPPVTTMWTQTDWNVFDGKAAHFCGKWLGGNGWVAGDTIDINATVLDSSDNNTTYLYHIDGSGTLSTI